MFKRNLKWQKLQKIIFIIFISIVIVSIALYYLLADEFAISQIRLQISGFSIWAPVIFILLYIVGTIFIPSTPFMAVAGLLFGFRDGLTYSFIGGMMSSFLVFSISRKLGKNWVDSILEAKHLKQLSKYNDHLEKGGILDLIILRILPIMPFNVLNILMGVSDIRTGSYILGTFLGLIPSSLISVYFGTFITKLF